MGIGPDSYHHWHYTVTTPEGKLTWKKASNRFTTWETEFIIKTPEDFELWKKYYPRPIAVDWTPVIEAKNRIGDRGIVRSGYYDFGQGSPWQSFADYLFGPREAIYACYDDPDWVHSVLQHMLERKLEVIDLGGQQQLDLVECGGGGGSSTVISPKMHREFCLPYDKIQIKALHDHGTKVVYHLCGGLMPLLETVVENGADALETMTPPEMGGDCDLAEATRRVGDQLAFVGGFDQNRGFEKGNPEVVKKMVRQLFESCPDGGYICSPSDHFFFGSPENIRAFAEACRECVY
jgi:uroporphyrinogen-III decarboxylase